MKAKKKECPKSDTRYFRALDQNGNISGLFHFKENCENFITRIGNHSMDKEMEFVCDSDVRRLLMKNPNLATDFPVRSLFEMVQI